MWRQQVVGWIRVSCGLQCMNFSATLFQLFINVLKRKTRTTKAILVILVCAICLWKKAHFTTSYCVCCHLFYSSCLSVWAAFVCAPLFWWVSHAGLSLLVQTQQPAADHTQPTNWSIHASIHACMAWLLLSYHLQLLAHNQVDTGLGLISELNNNDKNAKHFTLHGKKCL